MKQLLRALYCLLVMLSISSCSDGQSPDYSPSSSELPLVSINGYEIPRFPVAQAQLNHAKLSFAHPEEKRAALQAVMELFPKERLPCAHAALYLAYMHLGPDYRFTGRIHALKAVAAYEQLMETYRDLPEIVVKAYWYVGWIYCDIAGDKEKGLAAYNRIVEQFPDLEMGILPPVPWVSLVYPVEQGNDRPVNYGGEKPWASIALLEIIRHSEDGRAMWNAFGKLWEKYRMTIATGLALKHILQHTSDPDHTGLLLSFVDDYLQLNIANIHLAREIRSSAEKWSP